MLTVRLGNGQFLVLALEFDLELCMYVSQSVQLINRLIQPLS
jgi:hypothetical protein